LIKDKELLKKLHREPECGMELLIDEYAGLVHAVVRSKLLPAVFCEADIEGCVADVFSEFYCDLDKYSLKLGSIKSWLCVIAKHNAIDYLRRYYKEAEVVSLDDETSYTECADDFSLEGSFEKESERMELMKAVKALGEPDCEIIVRKFYLSQSSKEIAKRLGMTVSNVDTRTHRAIKRLRDELGGNRL